MMVSVYVAQGSDKIKRGTLKVPSGGTLFFDGTEISVIPFRGK
jgi:hypothetical protein